MSECSHNCETCGENCPSRQNPADFIEKPHELSSIKKVIGVVSGKGGVGKSLVTSMMSVLMQRRGYQSAILDADVTGPTSPRIFGRKERAMGDDSGIYPVKTKTGIEVMSVNLLLEDDTTPVVWRGPIIAGTVKQFWTDVVWNDVDFMFVDMPPGTGDVPLTVFQSLPVDGIIVVTSPQELVSMIVTKAVRMAQQMDIPILGVVENMSYVICPDCGKSFQIYGESHVEEAAGQYGLRVLGRLPIDPKLTAACDKGALELFEGDWLDAAADTVEALLG